MKLKNIITHHSFPYLCAFASGIITAIAFVHLLFFLALVCLVPLLYSIGNASSSRNIKLGFVYGAGICVCGFQWMAEASLKFSGNALYGIIAMIVCTIGVSVFYAAILWLYSKSRIKKDSRFNLHCNAVLFSSLWVLIESARYYLMPGLPFMTFNIGWCSLDNIYAIQHVSYAGFCILSFFVVLINFLVFNAISTKNYKAIIAPLCICVAFLGSGYLLLKTFIPHATHKSITVALADYNIPAAVNWDRQTGDSFAHIYAHLNNDAIAAKADLVVWPESAIPWTYNPNDDLAKLLFTTAAKANVYTLAGLNIPVAGDSTTINNSALLFAPSGDVKVCYKCTLLTFLETPLSWLPGSIIPFAGREVDILPGREKSALPSPFGNIGVLICNEAMIPAYSYAKKDINFFVTMSNDSWVSETYLSKQHLFANRLRAVETRKDICIVSNCGYTGMITAAGEMIHTKMEKDPFVNVVQVTPNDNKTLATYAPDWLLYVCVIISTTLFITKYKYDK